MKFLSLSLLIYLIAPISFANTELASSSKVEYFAELTRLKELAPKIKEYLILLELKNNKKLVAKRAEVTKLYDSAYTDEKLQKILIQNVQKKFTEKEINKLLAIFETKEMKKFIQGQSEILKEIINQEQSVKTKEFTLEIEKLSN